MIPELQHNFSLEPVVSIDGAQTEVEKVVHGQMTDRLSSSQLNKACLPVEGSKLVKSESMYV